MTRLQYVVSVTGSILLITLFVGLIVRRRARACWSFTVYVPSVLVPGSLMLLWPERFFEPDFWLFKEALHALLKFMIAFELTLRAFRAFPGARRAAQGVLLTGLLLTFVGVMAVSGASADYITVSSRVLPRILNGTIWLFVGIAALILWYRLPVIPMHKAILAGFVPYLLVFTVTLNVVDAFGWQLGFEAGYADTIAYCVVLIYWNHAAWRRDPPATRDRGVAATPAV